MSAHSQKYLLLSEPPLWPCMTRQGRFEDRLIFPPHAFRLAEPSAKIKLADYDADAASAIKKSSGTITRFICSHMMKPSLLNYSSRLLLVSHGGRIWAAADSFVVHRHVTQRVWGRSSVGGNLRLNVLTETHFTLHASTQPFSVLKTFSSCKI